MCVCVRYTSLIKLLTEHYCSPHRCPRGLWETGAESRFSAAAGNASLVLLCVWVRIKHAQLLLRISGWSLSLNEPHYEAWSWAQNMILW